VLEETRYFGYVWFRNLAVFCSLNIGKNKKGKSECVSLPHLAYHIIGEQLRNLVDLDFNSLNLLCALVDGLGELPSVRVQRVKDDDHFCCHVVVKRQRKH